ncbi:MAG: helix-turn-helix domain-containing protein [Desulfovibrionaceae bacterium]|nr:helix-turn-helix domain-containing protein [Desulfovibrionaceae bacterium]
MTLAEFGALLHAEREKRGLSLEEVAGKLKISSRVIKSLEEADTANFPHPAYAKGFLRSYGNFLGLDPQEISSTLGSLHGEFRAENQAPLESTAPIHGSFSRFLPQIVVMVLFLSILGGVGYLIWQRGIVTQAIEWVNEKTKSFTKKTPESTPDTQAAQAVKSQSSVESEAKNQPAKSDVVVDKPQPEQVRPVDLQANNAPRASLVEDVLPSQPNTKPNEAPGTNQIQPGQNPVGQLQQVIVVATEACWIHSSADQSEERQFSLRKGETFALSFHEKLELKLGNAGGVRFRYNGQDLPAAGKPGQVKTVVFPPTLEQ